MRSTGIMGLFVFGRSTEHEKRGCVGNASRAETVFMFGASALQFVEDTFTQEWGRRDICCSSCTSLPVLYTCSIYLILIFTTESIFFQH